ncbi:3-hydroxyacyl-ACP dehydratase [Flavobacterium sp. N2270]|uniref:3-hydroxyacyl-ACP dehydratase n=1 Tax=Flavobacterium sp. N2270 TaxID=2986831 RepID=UPI0022243A09|nr:3-hydroxyacyl-ACP dehydratase [Flavobacterium sp. N2270]
MLLKDFYKVVQIEKISETKYNSIIELNKDHDVFKGHFPGNPVTPGVCMMQIIKELAQEIVGSSLVMTSSSNVKFMAIINPEINATLRLELEFVGDISTDLKVKNTTYFDETVALKLTNTYIKA